MSDTTTPSWLSSLNDVANSPLVNGLLGMTQGFASAAMPSRMPIPFGAALGLAAAGMQAGMRNAYTSELARQQAETARLNNQLLAATMPYRTSLLGSLAGSSQPGSVAAYGTTTQPAQMGGAGHAAPMGVPQSPQYLVDPAMQRNLALYAMASGQDRAAAQLFSGLTSGAGGPGYAFGPSGTSFAIPGGPHDPSVLTRNTLAVKGPEAALDVLKAWQMLAPEAQKTLTAAGIDVNKAWQMPQSYMPGATVGSPQQLQAGNVPPDPFQPVAQRIAAVEGQGQNPGSTASGTGQFLAGTFPSVIRAVRPDLAAGKTDQQLLALRAVPGIGLSATEQYARQNGAALAQAGQPISPGSLYMSHLLGPNGAISVLRATDQTPLSAILPAEVIAKNPILQGKTAGIFRTYADQTMQGAVTQQGKAAQVPTSPQITEAEEEGKSLAKLPDTINTQAREGQNALLRIQQVKQAVEKATAGGLPPGYFSPELAEAAAAAKSLGIDLKPLGIDLTAVSNQQAAQEALVQVSGEILKRLFPQRITNMDIKLYSSSLPHYGMDPAALSQVLGLAEAQAKYDVDTGKSMNQWKADHNTLAGWRENHYLTQGYGPDVMQALTQSAIPGPEAGKLAAGSERHSYSVQNPARPQNAQDMSKLKAGDVYINPSDGKPYTYRGTGNAARP